MLIYTPKITNRLRYIFEVIFSEMLGLSHDITHDKEEFIDCKGAKLNYSSRQFEDELFFYAAPLLFERGIKAQRIKIDEFEDVKIFFISNNNSDLPFDLFAAAFFLITRYEEYLPHEKDKYGRYPAEASIAYQHHFLRRPIIDIWVNKLKRVLLKRFPDLPIRKNAFHFIPTYDIDIAYAYSYKGILRNTGGYLSSIKNMNFKLIKQRTRVLLGLEKDPYDTYDWQLKLFKYKSHRGIIRPIYFFLVGDYGAFDKNISLENLSYQNLIQTLGDYCEVGIHPSFESNKDIQILQKEIKGLNKVLKKDITRSRQHYIKLSIPETYERLIESDIAKDYSMGYPSQIGFRAGTASSFFFYNLSLEVKTNLKVYPFAVMDVTLKDYMNLTKKRAISSVKKMINEVHAVDGLFITLWHNHTLSDTHGWDGWQEVYEKIVQHAKSKMKQKEVLPPNKKIELIVEEETRNIKPNNA